MNLLQQVGVIFAMVGLAFALTCLVQWLLYDTVGSTPDPTEIDELLHVDELASEREVLASNDREERREQRHALFRVYLAKRYSDEEGDPDGRT